MPAAFRACGANFGSVFEHLAVRPIKIRLRFFSFPFVCTEGGTEVLDYGAHAYPLIPVEYGATTPEPRGPGRSKGR